MNNDHNHIDIKLNNKQINSYVEICYRVISIEKRPLKAKEIVEIALRKGIMPFHLYGKTQHKTIHARISEHILKCGENSLFFRVSPGVFYIRNFCQKEIFLSPQEQSKKHTAPQVTIDDSSIKKFFNDLCINFKPRENKSNVEYNVHSITSISNNGQLLFSSFDNSPIHLINSINSCHIDLIDGYLMNAVTSSSEAIRKIINIKNNITLDNYEFSGLIKKKINNKKIIFFVMNCEITNDIKNAIHTIRGSEFYWGEKESDLIKKFSRPSFFKKINFESI